MNRRIIQKDPEAPASWLITSTHLRGEGPEGDERVQAVVSR